MWHHFRFQVLNNDHSTKDPHDSNFVGGSVMDDIRRPRVAQPYSCVLQLIQSQLFSLVRGSKILLQRDARYRCHRGKSRSLSWHFSDTFLTLLQRGLMSYTCNSSSPCVKVSKMCQKSVTKDFEIFPGGNSSVRLAVRECIPVWECILCPGYSRSNVFLALPVLCY